MAKTIRIKIIPRSSLNEIGDTFPDGTIKVKLTAAPVNGEANEALLKFLSKEWNIPKNNISIKIGFSSRIKVIEIID